MRLFVGTCLLILAVYVALLIGLHAAANSVAQFRENLETELSNKQCAAKKTAAIVFYTGLKDERHSRTAAAFKLARKNILELIIAVGGFRPGEAQPYGSIKVIDELRRLGMAPQRLVFDKISNDTVSNLRSARMLMRKYGSQCAVFVSHKLHLVRIGMLSRRHFKGAETFLYAHSEKAPLGRYFYLLNYEVIAYLSLLLPRRWVEYVVDQMRQTFRAD